MPADVLGGLEYLLDDGTPTLAVVIVSRPHPLKRQWSKSEGFLMAGLTAGSYLDQVGARPLHLPLRKQLLGLDDIREKRLRSPTRRVPSSFQKLSAETQPQGFQGTEDHSSGPSVHR